MNSTVESLGPCKKLVRFEEDATVVDETFESVTRDFQKKAAISGFRPGKAPRQVVEKQFEKEILDEVKWTLMQKCFKAGLAEHKLNMVGHPEVEEIQFQRGKPLLFAARIETAPEFELPEYRGLTAQRQRARVTDSDLEQALEVLRKQQATYLKVDRAIQEGDFPTVNYLGTCEGRPITDLAPVAKGLTQKEKFMVEVRKDAFLPGFADQLIGAKAGEKRTVTVQFPADFVTPELAGKQGVFEVDVVEVQERVLPAVDETFAKSYGATDLAHLREGVRADLQNELNAKLRRDVRSQIIRNLLEQVHCDLPDSHVEHETRNVVYDIVSENQRRGVSPELIEQEKEGIYSSANRAAKDRVKAAYVFGRIAEKEGIRVDRAELEARLVQMAAAHKMPADKLVKELQKSDGLKDVQQEILREKVITFLYEHAKIEEVEPGSTPNP